MASTQKKHNDRSMLTTLHMSVLLITTAIRRPAIRKLMLVYFYIKLKKVLDIRGGGCILSYKDDMEPPTSSVIK